MPALIGPALYIYVCTRLRVRKTRLIPREEYLRMLNMSLPEITRSIQETEYKREIDELSHAFSGINLLETALSWNLAKDYQGVIAITVANLQEMTRSYLRSWDIQNVLTILRGKRQGLTAGRIKEVLVPAGELDRPMLDRLLTEDPAGVVEGLKGWRLYPALVREFPEAMETDTFARLENELYKEYYSQILEDSRNVKGGKAFLEYIRLAIDIQNLQNLFRLRAQGEKENAEEYMIEGGSFTLSELNRLHGIDDNNEFLDALEKELGNRQIISMLEGVREQLSRGERTRYENEVALIRLQLARMVLMSQLRPFSIWPILAYLELKKYEIYNLRAITRGKEANLPMDKVRAYLVM